MMTNKDFLESIRESFYSYLCVGTSRSTAIWKTLHGDIAKDLAEKFGADFSVHSQGWKNGREANIEGRYFPKKVDITVKKEGKAVAGYAVKFVMRNYSQNTNNYFENMLGETANIRSNSIPYFQIFIVFDKVPYYENSNRFKKYDIITPHNMDKYLALSKDDPAVFYHVPDKTLIVLIKLKEKAPLYRFRDHAEYIGYYKSVIRDPDLLAYAPQLSDPFDDGIIFNDYEDFIERTYYITLGRLKRG